MQITVHQPKTLFSYQGSTIFWHQEWVLGWCNGICLGAGLEIAPVTVLLVSVWPVLHWSVCSLFNLAAKNIGDFTTKDINGNTVDMSRYLGFVTIMVNVASEWGLTKREYTQLQELYNKYQKDGLRIVAFPSNEFGNQEPGDNSVIEDFVTQKFGVTFDMMAKTTVNGDNPEPVIAWAKNHPNGSGFLFNTIKWVRFL